MLGAYLVCIITFVFVFSFIGASLLKLMGIPNMIPLTRDFLLMALAFSAISQIKLKENKFFYSVVLIVIFILIANVFIAMSEGSQFQGLYYARVYTLPLLFAIACRGWLFSAEKEVLIRIIKLTYVLGIVVIFSAILLYIAIQVDQSVLAMLTGGDLSRLASAWFIAGGWIRMGLPMTAPNHLGLVVALFFVFLISIKLSGALVFLNLRYVNIIFLLSGVVLVLTFSRSSWLAALFGIATLLLMCWKEWKISTALVMRVTLAIVIGIVFLVALVYSMDDYSEGIISNWVSLNLTGKDPSMIGHGSSFTEAWESMDEYYLHGYARGSVGSRALVSLGDMKNVENTFLIIFYDMGFPIGMLFIISSSLILMCLFRHSSQISMVAVFTVAGMFLPYVFAPEIVITFLFMYSIQGSFMSLIQHQKHGNIIR